MRENKSYYAVIPADVRYDKCLCGNAKLLYGEITALCNDKGFCWANNQYFQDLYEVGKNTIVRWLNELIDGKYIEKNIQYGEDGKTVLQRCLSISNDTRWYQKRYEGSIKNDTTPSIKNDTHNNTKINNTLNNISLSSARELELSQSLNAFLNLHKNITIDSYNGELGEIDFNLLHKEIILSDWLQQITSFSWMCQNYKKVIAGKYRKIITKNQEDNKSESMVSRIDKLE